MAPLPEPVVELDVDPVVPRIDVGGRGEGERHANDARRGQVQMDHAEDPGTGGIARTDEQLPDTHGVVLPGEEEREGAPQAEVVDLLRAGTGAPRGQRVLDAGDVLSRADPDLLAEAVRDEREPVQVVRELAEREAPPGALADDVLLQDARTLPPHVGRNLVDAKQVPSPLFGVEEEVDVAFGAGGVARQLGRGRAPGPRPPGPRDEVPRLGRVPSGRGCRRGWRELLRADAGRRRGHGGRDEERQARGEVRQDGSPGSPRNERTPEFRLHSGFGTGKAVGRRLSRLR